MFGTLTTYDLLQSRFQYANERVADIGEDRAYEGIKELLDDQNIIMRQLVAEYAMFTTRRDQMYGGGDVTLMTETDEMGTAPPSKVVAGSVVGFPLRRFEKAWQGSKKWLQRATLGELYAQVEAMRYADRLNVIRQLKLALFSPTNYTWIDYIVDHRTNPPIAVKALVNADGMPIPPGPNGEIFNASTHTHYLGTASFSISDMVALKQTVLEHYGQGDFVISIPTGLESTVRTFTPNFVAALPTGQRQATTAIQIPDLILPMVPIASRVIGEFDGITVIVKPWMPAAYVMCNIRSHPVVGIRVEEDVPGAGDLQIDAQDEDHPLRAETYSREFGVGVLERTGCAILYTSSATYAAPAI